LTLSYVHLSKAKLSIVEFWLPQAIYVTYSNDPTKISLAVWITIAGASYSIFAFLVPTLHSLGIYTAVSLLLTMTITFISLGISIKDGTKRIDSSPRLLMFALLVNSLTHLCIPIDERFNVDRLEINLEQ
jgi:uncharacterized protein with PQ loop repeat